MFSYAISQLRSPDAAEEVVRQAFVAAWRHLQLYSDEVSERGWMMGILKRWSTTRGNGRKPGKEMRTREDVP